MRIPSGDVDKYIYFVGVDATDFATREPGLTGFTVYRDRNGNGSVAMTTPTVEEVDAVNRIGDYRLLVDEDTTIDVGNDSEEMCLNIQAPGMATVTRTIELYRPKITQGNTLGVESDGDLTKVNTCETNTDMRGTDNALLASSAPANFSDLAITVTTGLVSVGTNNDKTGYDLNADQSAVTIGTVTTNTDMRGTDGANTVTPPTAIENADALLDRDMAAGSDLNSRSPRNALRTIRNKASITGTTLTVTKEDDATVAYTATVTSDPNADPITGIDPA